MVNKITDTLGHLVGNTDNARIMYFVYEYHGNVQQMNYYNISEYIHQVKSWYMSTYIYEKRNSVIFTATASLLIGNSW